MAVDGGYSWVVLGASIVCLTLQSGITATGGILYVIFLEYFQTSPTLASLVVSINTATFYGIGPLMPVLIGRFGCRPVTMFGTLLAVVGLVSVAFAESVWLVSLTYGLIVGVGCGMCLIPAFEVINIYFDKRKSMALTLASLGTGFGPIMFPPLIDYLADVYGWRGAILVSCGVYLHALICALLFIPNKQGICRVEYVERVDCEKTVEYVEPVDCEKTINGTIPKGQGLQTDHKECDRQNGDLGRLTDQPDEKTAMMIEEEEPRRGYEDSARPDEIEMRVRMSNSACTLQDPPEEKIILKSKQATMNYRIFRKVSVMCLLLNAVFMGGGYNSFNDLFPAFVYNLGYTRAKAALALSAASAANVAGRLIFAVLYIALSRRCPPDRPLTLYILAASGGGLILCLARLVQSYTSVIVYAIVFGLIFGGHGTVFPNVILGIGKQENFASLYGASYLLVGLGCLAGPPFAGWIYEETLVYSSAMISIGVMLIMCGVVMFASMLKREWFCCQAKPIKQ